jgi:2,4-dienoyl-CoA reductase-like NADH-dependent reductase (Old Yellow Enzyme family)/NADPH-dependent 2,4-dienoyl-CoA reductase/sulfur reductase-like enzyme
MNHEALLQPLRIRQLTLRNRIVSTAHAPGYGFDSLPDERYRLYHEEKAKGGVALTMIGGSTAVSPDAVAPFGQLTAAEDRIIPPMAALAQAVRRHGAAVFCQISHPGRRGKWDGGAWLPPVAPSIVREPQHRGFPKQMEDWDFSRIRDDFVVAALRCKVAGLDGIELLFAGGHLMLQLFSPAVNRRADDYGGSLANRMRYPLEVIRAVRQAIGENLVMGVRITADEFIAEGLDQAECLAVATGLAGSGDVDYLSIMASQTYDWRSSAFSIPGMAFPEAPYLSLAGAIKAAVPIPVLQAAWIHDLATANRAVAAGQLDLVGMTRAQIADPHMVNKLLQGRSDDIRPCVGANYCINRIYAGAESLCVHNPATGREATMPQVLRKADAARRVVVVGGGPGGLEAARVCAARGHSVVLFEAEPECGGQVRVAAQLGWRRRLGGITDWLVGQCRKHGVDLRTSVTADQTAVLAEQPDVVIVATGGVANKGPIEGTELAVTSWDILTGKVAPGKRVLLFDDHGGDRGLECAQFLVEQGTVLEMATPERHVGIDVGGTTFSLYLRALYEKGAKLSPDLRLRAVRREGNALVAELRNEYTLKIESREVDQVVAEHGTLPCDELYFALKPLSRNRGEIDYHALVGGRPQAIVANPAASFLLYRVGDAVASRNIHAAIFDSLRLCHDI